MGRMAALRQHLLDERALRRFDLIDLPQGAIGVILALDRQYGRLDVPAFGPDVERAESGTEPDVVPLPEGAVHVRVVALQAVAQGPGLVRISRLLDGLHRLV